MNKKWLVVRLDGWITKAVNTCGPEITGMEVRVENVRVSFLSGQATSENFTLGNPMGFCSPRAMKVASVSGNLELTSLLSQRSSSGASRASSRTSPARSAAARTM